MNTNPIHPSARQGNTWRSLKTLALTTLTVVGLGLALAGPAAAICAPDAYMTLGLAKHSVSSSSNGGGYASVGCQYWAVDISVPSNSSGTGNDLKSFTIWANEAGQYVLLQGAACQNFWDRTYVYKKPSGAQNFQSLAYWERKGEPNPDPSAIFPCTLKDQPGAIPLPKLDPPASGKDVYRVMSARKNGASWVTVIVQAEHLKP